MIPLNFVQPNQHSPHDPAGSMLDKNITLGVVPTLFITCALLVQLVFYPKTFCATFRSFPTSQVVVVVPVGMEGAAREILSIFPGVKSEVEAFFNWDLTSIPSICVKKAPKRARGRSDDLVVGYAVPARHLIVIFYSRTKTNPVNLRLTLKHETCHLILHEHIRLVTLPRWLDEGIAQMVSGVPGEILPVREDAVSRLSRKTGGLISFRLLRDQFPKEPIRRLLAYAESRDFLNFFVDHFGKNALRSILQAMKKGVPAEQAFLAVTGFPLDDLETKWRASIKEKDTWIARLGYYMYEILFALAAIATAYAFVRQYRIKRAYGKLEDEDELKTD
ncbi:MAG: hypothetical protein DRH12_05445 [Deltaproteobacteria bacterium]|nr:MAG: hypothetical protein DRH12_05445 [Deltaproteobacteria bacterium]